MTEACLDILQLREQLNELSHSVQRLSDVEMVQLSQQLDQLLHSYNYLIAPKHSIKAEQLP